MPSLTQRCLGFVLIFLFYFIGEIAVRVLSLPLPGTLMGLLLLLVFQFFQSRPSPILHAGGAPLLKYMSVLFVPAVLRVAIYWQHIEENLAAVSLAIVGTTIVSLGIAALLAQRLLGSALQAGEK